MQYCVHLCVYRSVVLSNNSASSKVALPQKGCFEANPVVLRNTRITDGPAIARLDIFPVAKDGRYRKSTALHLWPFVSVFGGRIAESAIRRPFDGRLSQNVKNQTRFGGYQSIYPSFLCLFARKAKNHCL